MNERGDEYTDSEINEAIKMADRDGDGKINCAEYKAMMADRYGLLSHTGLIGSRFIQNYAFKGWLSLENMKLWLLLLIKTPFLMTLIIKLTLGNIFIKVKNPPGGATLTK